MCIIQVDHPALGGTRVHIIDGEDLEGASTRLIMCHFILHMVAMEVNPLWHYDIEQVPLFMIFIFHIYIILYNSLSFL